MLLPLMASLALAAPTVDGIPLDVAQGIWQIEIFRLPAPTLRSWLEDPDPLIRARAVRALGRLRDGEKAPALLGRVLTDTDARVRAEAAFAAGQTPNTGKLLVERWAKETDPSVRDALAVALGKQGGPESVKLLTDALGSAQAAAAAEGLGRLGIRKIDGAATETVARALLDHLGQAGLAPAHSHVAWALARMGLGSLSAETVARLARVATSDPDAAVRAWAVRAWAGAASGDERTSTLRQLMGDESAGVRIAAVRAVAKACPTGAVPVAEHLLADPDESVRIEAITALGTCPATAAGPLLRPLLASSDPLVAATALRAAVAAGTLDGPLEPWTGPDKPLLVRVAAAESLKDPDLLVKLARTAVEPPLRSAAAGALLAAEAPRLSDLLSLVAADDPLIAQAAADKLKEKPDPTAEKPLVDRLARGDLQAPEALSFVQALAAVYGTGTITHPAPGAAKALKPWLGLPDLGADATKIAAVLQLPVPEADHPTLRLPPLEEVLAIRSARILTAEGEIRVTLDPVEAPYTVWNFARLADQGYFDGIVFHRVVPDFVIQAGDPRGDGWGGPGYDIPDEINRLPYEPGALGMALSGPDTGGSQWFVTLSPQPHLEGTYTVFGRVTYGMRNAWAIQQGERIEKITIERVPWR